MITIPVYNMIILPNISLTFKKDFFDETAASKIREGDKLLFLFQRKDKSRRNLTQDDFYPIGLNGVVESVDDDGDVTVRTEDRMDIGSVMVSEKEIFAEAVIREDIRDADEEERRISLEAMKSRLYEFLKKFPWGLMARAYVTRWKSAEECITALSSYLTLDVDEKYRILEADRESERLDLIEKALYGFIAVSDVSTEAQEHAKETNEKLYREDALKKQIGFLQDQLDNMHPENVSDVSKFQKKIEESGMNETARREADKVLERMKQEGKNSHEYGLLYDYLDFVTSLEWKKARYKKIDLDKARETLDEDHYGLKKVKNRVIQQLAVMSLNKKQSGSILLFVGAPGTGKTSIGQSIAKALGRKYVRISLGGVRDEAEIRGHRRTYIGAMPGRLMNAMKNAGTSNPVIVLDEVDKLSRDYSGDPSSALLEVLDPEQNFSFTDHYMNVPYDLSDVLFVCTANTTDTIPEPLLNRMEVIQFPGYTAVEKFQIAKRHLLPRARKATGISEKELEVPDETIRAVIDSYTMESGVRGLKKQMDTLCRYAAVEVVENKSSRRSGKSKPKKVVVSPDNLRKYLDQKPIRHDSVHEEKRPGIVTGLAWTAAGGEILFIETLFTKGNGKVVITGQLGDVMKESVQIAISLIKAMYPDKVKLFSENDLHIHVPEGAIPKDGPSAGITLTCALASLVTGREVSPEWAMTGEVSLRGGVMPIGGLPEKLMAAQRAGIRQVFIPDENRDDLDDVADEVKNSLQIFPVKKISDVLEKLDLHPAVPEKKGKKKKTGIPADPFGNMEAFWGINKSPIAIRPVEGKL
ncbi:MAG: endopeptidase La [Lachnospiraceae bacterium]|nr:endopeptidase La [Lachnospiraceae bacterium]